jgi:hypothetical protein
MSKISRLVNYIRYSWRLPSFPASSKKIRQRLQNNWGKESDTDRDFSLIAPYFDLAEERSKFGFVDKKTWHDLNLDDVFCRLDRTVSAVGRQYLYKILRCGRAGQKDVLEKNRQYKIFRTDSWLREEIQLILKRLEAPNASFIIHLLLEKTPPKPRLYLLIYFSSLVTVCSLVLMIFTRQYFYIPLLLGVVNIIIHAIYSRKLYQYFPGLSYLNTMLAVAVSLAKIENVRELPQLTSLRNREQTIKIMRKAIGWMVIDRTRLDDLTDSIVEYLNLICLFDLVAFIRSLEGLKKHQSELAKIFEEVASLDASISVASYIESLPEYCAPDLTAEGEIQLENACHPLLDDPVGNSYSSAGKSALITGSNMAGKTTFIKTVGVNAILAHSIGICLACRAVIPQLAVKSSMRREDALGDGKSYYFAEVEALLDFIELSGTENRYLFLIDEIYRGTNTIERISSATAVLNYLGKNNLVLVTTHDIELQDLLGGHYRMLHFSEQVEGEHFYFDYKLKLGPTSSRNAIKLLEICGYPAEITSKASSLARELSEKYRDS